MIMQYKLALCLYKLYNFDYNSFEFIKLNFFRDDAPGVDGEFD